jgi:antitoxin (DNA-binding transcriptional repressor) of toxin-antitoxin stability system
MTTMTIEDAEANLRQVIDGLAPGEEVLIVRGGKAVARLSRAGTERGPALAGCYRKPEFWMAPDFDSPLEEGRNRYATGSVHGK